MPPIKNKINLHRTTSTNFILYSLLSIISINNVGCIIPDRKRVVQSRKNADPKSKQKQNRQRRNTNNHNNLRKESIEGPAYRAYKPSDQLQSQVEQNDIETKRQLGQLTSCCTTYQKVSAYSLCGYYGQDCTSGDMPSHDSSDGSCSMDGLSFIGVSFSVNTAHGNAYSYNLQDQMPMENLIDRNYDYVMSMDEDGWLVGGGYKPFDYSGKLSYIDSSHTEILRVGSVDTNYGGTSLDQVYSAMDMVSFSPLSIFPEYVKGGGGHNSGDGDGDGSVPSGDITLVVSIAETYTTGSSYSDYEIFLNDLFQAMYSVGGGPCMDDDDTDPHVSMSRGVKFKSSYHSSQYYYKVNLEVAVWQAMYPKGVVMGTSSKAAFPPERAMFNRQEMGYGNLYFFFDRANITKHFSASRDLSSTEEHYATLMSSGAGSSYYQSVTTISFDYTKGSHESGDNDNQQSYEHNPCAWKATMAKHDMTDGWDLPPNCDQEGEGFFGMPLSRASASKLQTTTTFQEQFDFEVLTDRNFSYVAKFGTNHGWLLGEKVNNGPASIVDKDTAHVPLFYHGTTNPDMEEYH